ncbi:MAG: hypothetical protein SO119_06605 [Phascolarctobacterium sp.]|nr:hypothetical protein [Phascolarctobacterium sp.]
MFTPFTTVAFWYWLYNQLFFLIGSLGVMLILFVTGLMQLGAVDAVFSFILSMALLRMLYRWFDRFYWRSRLEELRTTSVKLAQAALFPIIGGCTVLTLCFALAGGNHKETMIGMPFLAVINLSFSYLPLANSVWTMLVLAIIFNLMTLGCFWSYCEKHSSLVLPLKQMLYYLLLCFITCTAVIYFFTLKAL